MAFHAQINFRQTNTYVSDGEGQTYCLADQYPVTRGGLTFGLEVYYGSANYGRNRSTAYDVRLAGVVQKANDGNQNTFRLDLPNAGRYLIGLAIGDAGYAQGYQYVQVRDNTTELFTVAKAGGTAIAHFLDGAATDHTAANWPANCALVVADFASTILRVAFGSPSAQTNSSTIAHLSVLGVAGPKKSAHYEKLRVAT